VHLCCRKLQQKTVFTYFLHECIFCLICIGYCDFNTHCEPGLKCFTRSAYEPIPGYGGEGDWQRGYCYNPTFPFSLTAECSIENPCRECQGGCEDDFGCIGDLVCYNRNGNAPVPGCVTGGDGDFTNINYCHEPLTAGPVTYIPGYLSVYQNSLELSAGLTSRIIARSGHRVNYDLGGTSSVVFHSLPDGAGVFPTPDGGWVYASNSEDYSSRDSSRVELGPFALIILGESSTTRWCLRTRQ